MISLLVAYTKKNRVIGCKGAIPWNIPSERQRFKQICNGKKVIMGHNTFQEIGHALPYCTIIIVSKTLQTAPEGCLLANSLDQAYKMSDQEILVAGGAEIYKQSLPYAQKIYATEILKDFSGDTFFPPLDQNWHETERTHITKDIIQYDYVTFERK